MAPTNLAFITPTLPVPGPTDVVQLDRTGHIAYLVNVFERGMRNRIRVLDVSSLAERPLKIDCYICDAISWSPDGRFIAYSGTANPPSGHSEVSAIDVATGAIKLVTNSPGAKYGISLSPDGDRAIIDLADPHSGEPDLAILNLGDGAIRRLPRTSGRDYNPAWSPDGQRIAYAYSEDYQKGWQIWLTGIDGEKPEPISNLEVGGQFSWSPDGTRLAISSPVNCGSIYILDVRTHTAIPLAHVDGCSSNPVWSPTGRSVAFVNKTYVDPEQRLDVKEWRIYLVSIDGKHLLSLRSKSGNEDPYPIFLGWTPN